MSDDVGRAVGRRWRGTESATRGGVATSLLQNASSFPYGVETLGLPAQQKE